MHQPSIDAIVARIFVAIPVIALGVALLSWLRYGVDLPFFDDWRDYTSGEIGSLSLSYLFRPANSTLFPVGKVLDSLAQRFLDGNTIAYQFLSMLTVLGTLLWLQWKLLRVALGDTLLAACCFALVVFSLQLGTYWGVPNLGYHQAIPIVCLLGILYLTLCLSLSRSLVFALVLSLGLLAGFSYISGAFAGLAAAIAMGVAYRFLEARRELLWSASALALASVITVPAQSWVILVRQGGQLHTKNVPWTYPNDLDFWLFLLGKVARSLALPETSPQLSLSVALAILLAVVTLAVREWRTSRVRIQETARDATTITIFSVLAAAVLAYALMVGAARTYQGTQDIDSYLGAFLAGFPRFHFFWITIIWPWSFALLVCCVRRKWSRTTARQVASGLAIAIFAHAILSGQMNTPRYFKEVNRSRTQFGIACLQGHLQAGTHIDCPFLSPWPLDPGFSYAMKTDASFTKYFKHLTARETAYGRLGRVFDLKTADENQFTTRNLSYSISDRTMEIKASGTPQIIIHAGEMNALENCNTIEISAGIRVARVDHARVFYRPVGVGKFSATHSSRRKLKRGWNDIDFSFHSAVGFTPRIRLDPFSRSKSGRIDKLTVHCSR